MKRSFITKQLCFLLCFSLVTRSALAQPLGLSEKVNGILHGYCSVCRNAPDDSMKILSTQEGIDDAIASFHNCIASLRSNDQDKAFGYALKTIAATGPVNDTLLRLYAIFLKARILYLKDGYQEALAGYLRLTGSRHIDPYVSAYVYSNIASIYVERKEFDKALNYFAIWESRYLPYTEMPTVRKIYNNMGVSHLHLENYERANQYFRKSIAIAEQLKDTLGLANLYINIGSYYYNLDLAERAFPFFRKALAFALRLKNNEILFKAYQNMAIIEAKSHRYRQAYEYRKLYDSVIGIKWNSDNISSLKDQERKLAVQEQEHKLLLSQQENRLQASELNRKNWQRNTLFALAILFLFFAAFLYVAYQQKVKRNAIISAQREELSLLNQTKDRLFSIISHDLRTLVYTLKITLTRLRMALSQNLLVDAASLAESTEKISSSTYALLNNLLHWALSQTDQLNYKPEKAVVKELTDQVHNDLVPVAAAKSINLMETVPDDLSFSVDVTTVKIILRNIVDNAIKYTPCSGTIHITAVRSENSCNITVSDNGIGMEQHVADAIVRNHGKQIQKDTQGNRSTGLGLWLVKTMTEQNGGSLSIRSRKGEGTAVTVSFPLPV